MQWPPKTSVKASLPSLHYKPYPFLGLCVPQAILDSTFVIVITNVTFYYSTTLASVYASSVRRAVCIICRILALYSANAAETISKGLKSKFFLGYFPVPSLCASYTRIYVLLEPPCKFLPTPLHTHNTHTHTYTHTNIYTQKILTMHTHINTHTNKHTHTHTHTHNQAAHTRFNLVACNRYLPLSCLVYGNKLLSCSLTAKVASELPQCLFQATSCVKDQRHRSFVTSHSAKTSVYFIIAVTRGNAYVLVFTITEPLALKDPLSSPKTSISSPPSPSLHLEIDDQSVSCSCFGHTFTCSRSIHNFRKVGLKQQHLAL